MADRHVTYRQLGRRQPRLVQRTAWLRRHPVLVDTVAWGIIGCIFVLDVAVDPPITLSGFYLLSLTLLALAGRVRMAVLAGLSCLGLAMLVMGRQDGLHTGDAFNLVFGIIAGVAAVVTAYLVKRLTMISEFAMLRAQLSEAGADILVSGRGVDDVDGLLEYALERLGEQLDATGGVLLLLDDGVWRGRVGFGLNVDAHEVLADEQDMSLALDAMRSEAAVVRDIPQREGGELGSLSAHLTLERVLVVPLQSLERQVGVLVYSRPKADGDFDNDQVGLAEGMGRYLAVALDNVRLMRELERRRRDLELVRDSSLDFSRSLDMSVVIRAVVKRLVAALDMDVCDVYEVDQDEDRLRLLVSFENGAFDMGEWVGHEVSLGHYASSALAVSSLRPVCVTSPDDPRLNEVERDQFVARGYKTQLGIPLRIGERVLALVELFDTSQARDLADDEIDLAASICRFAAQAVDKAQLYDRQRASAERLDRLAQRLQRLQSFAVELNRHLDMAQPQEVLDEVALAAVGLFKARVAAVVTGAGEYMACKAMRLARPSGAAAAEAAEAELLGRCRRAIVAPEEDESSPAAPARVSHGQGLLLAPLESESPQLGGTLVVADKDGCDFDGEDELLIATLAAQAGVSLHNVTAYQREHAIAETFQQALLMEPPAIPGIDLGVRYRAATEAARVGGDFYDLVQTGPGRLLVIVGDVCGKSLSAAAESAVVRYMLRAYAAEGSPGEALSRLNSAVMDQLPGRPFVTLVVAYVDVARHMFEYAVAGHPRPVVLAGRSEFPLAADGHLPVGIFRGNVYPTNRAILPDDSTIVLYTDGMTDARADGVLFGERRLRQRIADHVHLPAQQLADTLLDEVSDHAGGVLPDDCAIVAVKLP